MIWMPNYLYIQLFCSEDNLAENYISNIYIIHYHIIFIFVAYYRSFIENSNQRVLTLPSQSRYVVKLYSYALRGLCKFCSFPILTSNKKVDYCLLEFYVSIPMINDNFTSSSFDDPFFWLPLCVYICGRMLRQNQNNKSLNLKRT